MKRKISNKLMISLLAVTSSTALAFSISSPALAHAEEPQPVDSGIMVTSANASAMTIQTFDNIQALYAYAVQQNYKAFQTDILNRYLGGASAETLTDSSWTTPNSWGPAFLFSLDEDAVDGATQYGLVTIEVGGVTYGIDCGELENNLLMYLTLGDNGQQVDYINGQPKAQAQQELATLNEAVQQLVSSGGSANIKLYTSETEVQEGTYSQITGSAPTISQNNVSIPAATAALPQVEITVYENAETYYNAIQSNSPLASAVVEKFLGSSASQPYNWETANAWGPVFQAHILPPAGTATSEQYALITVPVNGVNYSIATDSAIGKGVYEFFTFGDGGKNIEFVGNNQNPGNNVSTFDGIVSNWMTDGINDLGVQVRYGSADITSNVSTLLSQEASTTETVSLPKQPVTPTTPKEELQYGIESAQALMKEVNKSYTGRDVAADKTWSTPAEFAKLEAAVNVAQEIYNNAQASADQLTAATKALNEAIAAFTKTTAYGEPLPTYALPTYIDVDGTWAWNEGVIQKIASKGIMVGWKNEYGQHLFGPAGNITRGQVACTLYRYAVDEPVNPIDMEEDMVKNTTPFTDVLDGKYYTAAMNWAYKAGVFKGYSGTELVGPDDPITREQLATVLYRYAVESVGTPNTGAGAVSFEGANGANTVSGWAADGVGWAYYNKVMTGYAPDGFLGAQDFANRGQAAKMLSIVLGDVIGW